MRDTTAPRESELGSSPLAPIPRAVLAGRRRALRWVAVFTFLGGLGLSALPGPLRGVERSVTSTTNRGVTTQVHEFTFGRSYGFPFQTVHSKVGANGELKEASLRGEGIKGLFGNFAAAFVIALAFTWLLNRRTRV